MRTAVVRIDVDPSGGLSPEEMSSGVAALRALADQAGIEVVDNNLAAMPRGRREAEFLIAGADEQELKRTATTICSEAFGTVPAAGTLTYVSRGTDEDAHGVLAGFGLAGDVSRSSGEDGYDILDVTLRKDDLARIPESRVYTALEAATNCEVRIRIL